MHRNESMIGSWEAWRVFTAGGSSGNGEEGALRLLPDPDLLDLNNDPTEDVPIRYRIKIDVRR